MHCTCMLYSESMTRGNKIFKPALQFIIRNGVFNFEIHEIHGTSHLMVAGRFREYCLLDFLGASFKRIFVSLWSPFPQRYFFLPKRVI